MNSEITPVTQIQDRGQFFVRYIGGTEPTVPIDNFLFIESDHEMYNTIDQIANTPNEIKLESHGGEVTVCWKTREDDKYETYNTKAQALRRLADILDGTVTFDVFGDNGIKFEESPLEERDFVDGGYEDYLIEQQQNQDRIALKNKIAIARRETQEAFDIINKHNELLCSLANEHKPLTPSV